ncbi:hypothetical protein DMN91_011188 [Ooceraea biroi]|uniref:PDZ domain-containing protein n=1 Tax=Ooceraea biroi TaxID=2015173 RepID=A0A3L8DB61_OOCBI|nr:hypothetical protein DMN91_011188 [Ooceraea biroi]
MSAREVTLHGGSPWGFRMHGGCDTHQPLRISRVNPGSKAAQQGVREGDLISNINGRSTRDLTNSEAHALLRNSGEQLKLGLNQENTGSPKRRIYKSSLQENTTTEIHNKITTRTTTTTRTRTEAEKNVATSATYVCLSDHRSVIVVLVTRASWIQYIAGPRNYPRMTAGVWLSTIILPVN